MSYASLLTDTITVALPGAPTSYGEPTWGAQATMRARVEFGTKMMFGADGTQRECEAVIATTTELPLHARIWLPGANTGDANAAKRPIQIKRASRPGGGLTVYETYL